MLQFAKMIKFIFNTSNSLLSRNDKISYCVQYNFLQHQIRFCSFYVNNSEIDENKYKRKTARVSKITLIHPNSSVSVTLLEAAEKLAKRRHLELIEVSDSNHKSDRSVYKLINPIEYKDQDNDKKTKVNESNTKWKTTKLFNFKCNINDHDLDVKIRNINRALRKKHMVKIILIHPDENEAKILQIIKEKVQGNQTKIKTQKGVSKFTLSPLLNAESNSLNNADNVNESESETK